MALIQGYFQTNTILINGKELTPYKSQKLRDHSPDGFSWGYGGSGPAQLALAILLKFTSQKNALKFYQDFKWDHIARWPQSDFHVDLNVRNWIKNKMNEMALEGNGGLKHNANTINRA